MTEAEWREAFLRWYDETNRQYVDARDSQGMLAELRDLFDEASPVERTWLVGLLTEWRDSRDPFRSYDGRVLLPEFSREL